MMAAGLVLTALDQPGVLRRIEIDDLSALAKGLEGVAVTPIFGDEASDVLDGESVLHEVKMERVPLEGSRDNTMAAELVDPRDICDEIGVELLVHRLEGLSKSKPLLGHVNLHLDRCCNLFDALFNPIADLLFTTRVVTEKHLVLDQVRELVGS